MLADVQQATDVLAIDVVGLSAAAQLASDGLAAVAEQFGAGCGVDSGRFECAEFAVAEARQPQKPALVSIARTACCPQG